MQSYNTRNSNVSGTSKYMSIMDYFHRVWYEEIPAQYIYIVSAEINKNAFQWDAYRPQQLPSAGGGGVSARGVSARGCLPRGVSVLGGCLPRGVSAWGVSARGGGCLPGGVYPSMHWGRHPPPVDRMTDMCKNTTFPQLR